LLTGERTALNFIQRLSGIATMSRKYVDAVGVYSTRILDTRKTTPGLRLLEKYAVKTGGATNHRIGLYDRIMIKDNHRELATLEGPGGITRAVKASRKQYPNLEIEVEADTLDDVKEAVEAGVEYILLDNMPDQEMREAVKLIRGRSMTEASGGITLERIPAIAALGVDFISVGALTHSVRSVDIGLDIEIPRPSDPRLA
ncbi:MAG: carboxylating nicotinate-nucleotide diphosphorylase, partial [bacterium]